MVDRQPALGASFAWEDFVGAEVRRSVAHRAGGGAGGGGGGAGLRPHIAAGSPAVAGILLLLSLFFVPFACSTRHLVSIQSILVWRPDVS